MILFPVLPLYALVGFTQTYLVCLHPPSHQPDFNRNKNSILECPGKEAIRQDRPLPVINQRAWYGILPRCLPSMCNLVEATVNSMTGRSQGTKLVLGCRDLTRRVVWVWLWRQVSKTKTQKSWGEAWLMWLILGTRDICSYRYMCHKYDVSQFWAYSKRREMLPLWQHAHRWLWGC